jgi:hypothetical protein
MLCNLQHNIRFLQDILKNRKSDFLEWLIIILISVEILISVYNSPGADVSSPSNMGEIGHAMVFCSPFFLVDFALLHWWPL